MEKIRDFWTDNRAHVLMLLTVFGTIVSMYAILICGMQCIEISKLQQLESVEHYYLNGTEVDGNKIDVTLYSYSIKGDTCYLTERPRTRVIPIPVFFR